MSSSIRKLIALEPRLRSGSYGEWIVQTGHAGTREDPHVLPWIEYSDAVNEYIDLIYEAAEEFPEYDLRSYHDILHANGLEWSVGSLIKANVGDKDTQCVLAMLLAVTRLERFGDGALLLFLEEGHIQKWLRRLEELEN